jgi:folate-binding protein YgfZ
MLLWLSFPEGICVSTLTRDILVDVTETAQLAHDLIGPAAIAPITDRAFLRITGPDATRWLNGMVTNNIKDLAPGQGNYNFLLNAQGRIQGDCTIYREPNDGEATFLLETDNSQLETVHQTLDRFIIMDDVELSKEGTLSFGISVEGAQASSILTKALLTSDDGPLEPGNLNYITRDGELQVLVLPSPHKVAAAYELWTDCTRSQNTLTDWLRAAGATVISEETQEALRILSATPKYGTDIRNTDTHKDLPQETAQTHALHFAKGCYLGQEIVERIRSRGQVHRAFTQFTLTPGGGSTELPALPAPLTANEKPVGELTSAARIGDRIYALGYIRREILETHQPVTYPGGVANPTKP